MPALNSNESRAEKQKPVNNPQRPAVQWMEAATNNNETKTMRNSDVVRNWRFDAPASAGNLFTDGQNLFSYRLKIGFTTPKGIKVVVDHTAGSDSFHSMTTSKHVGMAKRRADEVMHPLTEQLIAID